MVMSMVPIFNVGTIASFMILNFSFLPKTLDEKYFHAISYVLVIALSLTGSLIYLSYGRHPDYRIPLFICLFFVTGRIVINFLSRRMFNEDCD